MDSIKKSITAKATLTLIVLGVMLAGANFVLADTYPLLLPYVLIGIFALGAALLIYVLLTRPLKIIFNEMKALLTGRPYKKIFTDRIDEVGVLAHFFNDVTKSIEKISKDLEEGRRMSKELSVGSDIQRRMLPTSMPSVPGLVMYGATRPASEVGGDSFDVIPTVNNNTLFYVGDVTGHGLAAGLIMVMVNTLIRTLAEGKESGYDIMINTNRLIKARIEQHRFMTCVLLRWKEDLQKMYYTGCGHEHIIVFHTAQKSTEIRKTGGIALGMVPDISKIIREEELPFEKNDVIVLYSDGIVEAKNMSGEMFGVERLGQLVNANAAVCTPEELFVTISKAFGEFVGDQIQLDDMTLIIVKRS